MPDDAAIKFESKSQVAQDRFAWEVSGRKLDGVFLDIGCNDLEDRNNTYALEMLGWRGIAVDRAAWIHAKRKQTIVGDATKLDWREVLKDMPKQIDYLSLDVDDATLDVLKVLPLDTYRFRCATIEHDFYRLGPEMRQGIHLLMEGFGYLCKFPNVEDQGLAFESWWVDPFTVLRNLCP